MEDGVDVDVPDDFISLPAPSTSRASAIAETDEAVIEEVEDVEEEEGGGGREGGGVREMVSEFGGGGGGGGGGGARGMVRPGSARPGTTRRPGSARLPEGGGIGGGGSSGGDGGVREMVSGRGLHSFPIQLNLSTSDHCIARFSS